MNISGNTFERVAARAAGSLGRTIASLATLLVTLGVALPALAVEITGQSVNMNFGPASGPVAGYFLYFQYNGEAAPGRLIGSLPPAQRQITVAGNLGEEIVVRLRPYASDGRMGPFSPPSEPIKFVSQNSGTVTIEEDHDSIASIFFPLLGSSDVTIFAYRSDRSLAGTFTVAVPAGASADAFRETRVARCDLDGDGLFEFALGFADGSNGRVEIRTGHIDGFNLLQTFDVGEAAFHAAGGGTFPACGDIDGDGLDELLIGRGPGGQGIVEVFDDFDQDFASLGSIVLDWTEYNTAVGETRPALGDLDADGLEEIAIGLGVGGENHVAVLDDYAAGFAKMWSPYGAAGWIRVDSPAADGSTMPAVVQLDNDVQHEIAVGLGAGSRGQIYVFDDGLRKHIIDYPFLGYPFDAGRGWLDVGWSTYNNANGATRPAGIDLDSDGIDELLVAYGANGLGRVELLTQGVDGPSVAGSSYIEAPLWRFAPNGPAVAR